MNYKWLKYLNEAFTFRPYGEKYDLKQPVAAADSRLQQSVKDGKVPGLVVAVWHNGEPLLQKGYGFTDLQQRKAPDPAQTRFRIASISKPIAATALLRMVDEGLIELDASLYDYVPWFPRKSYDFTIRQLAGHTAGIRGYRGMEYGLNKDMSIREGLEVFQNDSLLFKPGTSFHYNSFGWVLLSLAMEEASGIPFSDYVATKVLSPLGMHATIPEIKGNDPGGLATFYSSSAKGFRQAPPVNNEYKLAGGGYLSTASDIALFGQAYLDGGIANQTLVAEFLQSQIIKGEPTWYGLGWEVSLDAANRPYYGHTGNSIGAFSKFMVYPESRMIFVILVNCGGPRIEEEITYLIEACFQAAGNQ